MRSDQRKSAPRAYVPGKIALTCVAALLIMGQAPAPPSISPSNPPDVSIPPDFQGLPIDFFDDYSWQMFLTMVWPADPAARGEPDRDRPLNAAGPRVFETFRSNWETFQPGGARPPAFADDASVTPCPNTQLPRGAFVIAAFPIFDEFRLADFGQLAGPLAAQNLTWTRYTTGYNRIQYDHIRDNNLYIRTQPVHVRFPDSSVVVKSAWMDMANIPAEQRDRYYSRRAWVMDVGTPGVCVERLLGLVGLHIVKRTPSRPQWVWSTFEHVDTVPDGGVGRAWAYNDGSDRPMAETNPLELPTPQITPETLRNYNVIRVWPIHSNTAATNRRYRDALAARGSIWQNYQLVMTQWPVPGNTPANDGSPRNTFPGRNARTAFANTTMEPYEQADISSGCMACHHRVRDTTDYIWSVTNHAFRPNESRTDAERRPELIELRQMRRSTERANRRVLQGR